MTERPKFSDLVGKTLVKIEVNEDQNRITFHTADEAFCLYHGQDCCEIVSINDINGSWDDLIGSPLLVAEEATSENETPDGVTPPEYPDSYTWTFYKLATIKGFVDVR
jgi:hypothetical protein